MKAQVYHESGSPDVFRYEDVPEPKCPDNGLLMRVEAISFEGGDTARSVGSTAPHRARSSSR